MKPTYDLKKLIEIIAELRGPEGCPWDKKQNYDTIKACTLEEVHELFETIDQRDFPHMQEELGDVLLQVIFYSQFASEDGHFNINDVIQTLCEKLIHRHPHVFGDLKANNSEEALINWESSKKKTKKGKSLFDGVPRELPALLKAFRIGQKASNLGFDWPTIDGVLEKLEEEIEELRVEVKAGNQKLAEEEFGDVLFTLAHTARFLNINPEEALNKANQKFINRFHIVEKAADSRNLDMHQIKDSELEEMWQEAKKELSVYTYKK